MKKTIIITSLVASVLAICLLLLILLAPLLVNTDFVLSKVTAWVEEKTGSNLKFRQVDLRFFPRPLVTVSGISGDIPERGVFSAESMKVYLSFFPLLSGKVEISKVHIVQPKIAVDLAPKESASADTEKQRTSDDFFAGLALKFPGLLISVENGSLDALQKDRTVFSLKNINAGLSALSGNINADLSVSAGFAEDVKVRARIGKTDSPEKIFLEIKGNEVDVAPLREALLSFTKDNPDINNAMSYLREGKLQDIAVRMKGANFHDLGGLDDLEIESRISKGRVAIKGTDLIFDNVNGDFSISEAMLRVKNLSAGLDNAQMKKGLLTIGLEGSDAPFHLEADTKMDYAMIPALLDRFLKKRPFPLDRLRPLKGQATGRLFLGERMAMFRQWKENGNLRFNGKIKAYKGPEIDLAFSLGPEAFRITKLNIREGRTDAAMTFSPGEKADNFSFTGNIDRKTIDRLIDLPNLPEGFTEGDIKVSVNKENILLSRLFGRLSVEKMPVRLKDRASFDLEDLKLRADGSRIIIESAKAKISDNMILLNGTADISAREIIVDMDASAEQIRWEAVSRLFKKEKKDAESRVYITGSVRLKTKVFYYGSKTAGQVTAGITLEKERTKIAIRTAMLKVGEDTASVAGVIEVTPNAVAVDMDASSERLKWEAVSSLFKKDEEDAGRKIAVAGSIRLKTEAFYYGTKTLGQVTAGVTLDKEKTSIRIDTATLRVGDDPASVSGVIEVTPKAVDVDMDVTAKSMRWQALKTFLDKDQVQSEGSEKKVRDMTPLTGSVNFAADTVLLGKKKISPVHARISLSPDMILINMPDIKFCSIRAPGRAGIVGDTVDVDFSFRADAQELAPTLACISGDRSDITGKFVLKGKLEGKGRADQIVRLLNGGIEFEAEGGRINKSLLLLNIYSLLNVSGYFSGNITDLFQKGISYRSITLKADIRDGKMIISEANLDAPSMEMVAEGEVDLVTEKIDLKMLAVPLTTIDVLLGKVPFIGKALRGSIVSVPITVTGNLDDPVVEYSTTSGIGSGLVNFLKKVVEFPFTIVEPETPAE